MGLSASLASFPWVKFPGWHFMASVFILYQHHFLESDAHLLPSLPQSGVVGRDCWYGKAERCFCCLFVCFISAAQGRFLLAVFVPQSKAAVGFWGRKSWWRAVYLTICFHFVVLAEPLGPPCFVKVKLWRQGCRNWTQLCSFRQKAGGCDRNSRPP